MPLSNNNGSNPSGSTLKPFGATGSGWTDPTSTPSVPETCGELAFLRAKVVTFTADGLKPNTIYYPFFNETYVGEYCTTVPNATIIDGKVNPTQTTLKTNAVGSMTGNFMLPKATFVPGIYKFLLVDKVKLVENSTIPDTSNQTAYALYEGHAPLERRQSQATSDNLVTAADSFFGQSGYAQTSTTPPVEYVTYYFEYTVSSLEENKTFIVSSNSSSPPSNPNYDYGASGNTSEQFDVIYLSTTVRTSEIGTVIYDHKFLRINRQTLRTYRQEQVIATTDDPKSVLPNLAHFRPSGIADTDVVTILTRNDKGEPDWTLAGNALGGVSLSNAGDTIAQSFVVDASTYPNGLFVTSIGLYFSGVDQSTPVMVELREMSTTSGLPSSTILPFGRALLPGTAAVSSIDASLATRFNFDSPIYLRKGTEYCFVIKSSSLGYSVWTSKTGQNDIATDEKIDDNNFKGTFFKAASNNNWTPVDGQDMKFDLYKADFATNIASPTVKFIPYQSQTTNQYYSTGQYVPVSYLKTIAGSNTVELKVPYHGCDSSQTNYIFIQGATGVHNGITGGQLEGLHEVTVLDNSLVEFIVTGAPATATGNIITDDYTSPIDDTPPQMPPPTSFNVPPRLIDDTVVISNDSTGIAQPTPPSFISENFFKVYSNVPVHELNIDYMSTSFDGITTLTNSAMMLSSSYTPTSTQTLTPGQPYSYPNTMIVPSYDNSSNHSNYKSYATVSLSSTNKDVSPIVDTNGISLVTNAYNIDNQSGEWEDPAQPTTAIQVGKSYVIKTRGDFNWATVGKLVSSTGTISGSTQISSTPSTTKWSATLSNLDSTDGIAVGSSIVGATSVVGNFFYGTMKEPYAVVTEIINASSLKYEVSGNTIGSTGPVNGPINGIRSMLYGGKANESFVAGDTNSTSSTGSVYAISEIIPGQGVAQAKYKSTINTASRPYNNIKIFLVGTCPTNTNFDTYIRTSSDAATHVDENWIYLGTVTPVTGADDKTVKEWLFEHTLPQGKSFKVYDIKVVMRSITSTVPKIHGIRAILNNVTA